VSWQLASFLVLVIVLLGGFAWYERSRPPAPLLAMVASLAALAVAGRLLFTPLPNVVATTDIVLIAGYAVGAAPGFVIGALAALVSNFWLGQGPWTPWQMAGWGLIGLGGAALAVAAGRDLGRWPLAAACAVAGLLYGALLNLSLMVTYGGEQSVERFVALSARAIPFDVAHAAGNAVMALVAAPALVRMLVRFRQRSEVHWRTVSAATAAPIVLAAAIGLAATLPPSLVTAGAGSTEWLANAKNSDGGFGPEPGSSSNALITGWAMLGVEAAGRNPLDLPGRSPVAYLRRQGTPRTTGDLERAILALAGAGTNPRDFGGRDLVAALTSRRRSDGSFEGQVNLTAFGVLALEAAGSGSARSAAWLRGAQNRDGGWGFRKGATSDADTTGAVLQALVVGGGGSSIGRGVSYLRRAQRPGGGFGLAGGGPVNSQSTAFATQGLVAAGVDPGRVRKSGKSPLDYLAARHAGDGHYRYSASSDQTPVWVTAQALLAVNRKPFPLAAVPRRQGLSGTGNRRAPGGSADASPNVGGGAGTRTRRPRERQEAHASRVPRTGRPGTGTGDPSLERTGGPGRARRLDARAGRWRPRRDRGARRRLAPPAPPRHDLIAVDLGDTARDDVARERRSDLPWP
jgi:energy-coupling factor transport system substrate-specific component